MKWTMQHVDSAAGTTSVQYHFTAYKCNVPNKTLMYHLARRTNDLTCVKSIGCIGLCRNVYVWLQNPLTVMSQCSDSSESRDRQGSLTGLDVHEEISWPALLPGGVWGKNVTVLKSTRRGRCYTLYYVYTLWIYCKANFFTCSNAQVKWIMW